MPYQQVFHQGFASPSKVSAALGRLSFALVACRNVPVGMPDRAVRATSEKWDYESQRVAETVLYEAVQYAWRACPLHVMWGMTRQLSQVRLEVSSFELVLPDGSVAFRAINFVAALGAYRWANVDDIGLARRTAEANAAAAAAQHAEAAERAREAAEAQARYDAEQAAWWASAWESAKPFGCGIAGLVALIWLWRRRETLLRWYFFAFHPHPAEPMVRAALRGGSFDGNALSAALSELPSGNPILRGVRVEQGERLVAEMRSVSECTIAQDRRRAREGYEHAAHYGMQEAIALAAVALERARTHYAASKSI